MTNKTKQKIEITVKKIYLIRRTLKLSPLYNHDGMTHTFEKKLSTKKSNFFLLTHITRV